MRTSLIIVVSVLLCSCKTKEVAREIKTNERYTSEISVLNEKAKVDTTKTKKVEQTAEFVRITEEIKITEYDTEKQTVSKVTEKKKVTESDTKTKTAESEDRGLTTVKTDSLVHVSDTLLVTDIEEDIKESPPSYSLWKWIAFCFVIISIFYVYKNFFS